MFTGLYTRWESFGPTSLKIALIRSLKSRAIKICPDTALPDEVAQLELFANNGYPAQIVERTILDTIAKHESKAAHGRSNALLLVTISLAHVTLNAGNFSPGTCIAILDRLFHIATAMATTPFQADRQSAANTQKKLHARQAVENREEEGCVYIAYHCPI